MSISSTGDKADFAKGSFGEFVPWPLAHEPWHKIFPWEYNTIELMRDGWATSQVVEYGKIPPEMNVCGLLWRPANG